MKKILLAMLSFLVVHSATGGQVSYIYDAAGRLTVADYGNRGKLVYTYDKSGNLLSRTLQTGENRGPTLTIEQIAGRQSVLRWLTAGATDFKLQTASTLGPNAAWLTLTVNPAVVGGNYVLTNTFNPRSKAGFFRLSR